MNLGDRKRLILQAIIEDYINTAEPVGSRTISKKYLTNTSPATIRNEMADLEEMGYIEQPHTSAGRVPSDKGYRLYVDKIMEQKKLNDAQVEMIKREFVDTLGEIDRLIKNASRLLSQMTQYTSIIMTPQIKQTCIKHIQLIGINNTTILAVIVTDAGIVKNCVLRVMREASNDFLDKLTNMLNSKLAGLSFEQINNINFEDIVRGMNTNGEIIEQLLPELKQTLLYSDTKEIYHDGAANILNLPEFCDIQKAREFLNALEEEELLFNVLKNTNNDVSVSIGNENMYEQFRNCSLITATYKINGKTIGSVGVIGPKRMEYSKVISIVDCMTQNLSEMLTKMLKG
ncbi:MAG: heat-inducible transcriptional repressor HrcA [Bacillota bacterium]